MITKESIRKDATEIKRSLGRFYSSLEDLWEAAHDRDYAKIMRVVDDLQNYGGDCVSHIEFMVDSLADDSYELLDILDKKPELRMMDDALGILNDIKWRMDFWEKKKAELAAYNAGDFVDEDKGGE